MKTIHAARELDPRGRKVCLAIGFFDGVHLGHQQIIRQTISDARRYDALSLVVTFDRHPHTVVAPDRVPRLIYSLPQKLRTIESLGADSLLLLHFDKAFSEQSGEAFIHGLARDLGHVQSLCVGANFLFGYQRTGNVALLKQLGAQLNFGVHGLSAVSLGGKAVSSTRVRETIAAGHLDSASQMLGRPYSLAGTVRRGDGIGAKLGFPTANIESAGLVLPPNGVYSVFVETDPKGPVHQAANRHRAVLNIGTRPTLGNPNRTTQVEAHLPGFSGDLYDHELEVTFAEKLRPEKTFPSLDALREQISRDIARAGLKS
jgi:riboflavin kinase/FMN adenylyltransferase